MSTDSLWTMLATGGGLGYVPGLPGTAGALGGLLPALVLARFRPLVRGMMIAALVFVAVPVCEYGGRAFGGDDHRVVADELLAFPVASAALPVARHPGLAAGVFLVSRAMDGLKPPPVRAAERWHGGVGIVLDDVVANAWALFLVLAGWRAWRRIAGGPR